jgi:hypothetical protein
VARGTSLYVVVSRYFIIIIIVRSLVRKEEEEKVVGRSDGIQEMMVTERERKQTRPFILVNQIHSRLIVCTLVWGALTFPFICKDRESSLTLYWCMGLGARF